MTRTEEMIEVMIAYVNGKEVEWAVRDTVLDKSWTKANGIWNFVDFDYRIKPEEKVHEMTLSEIERELGYKVKVVS